jgi:hypothetical protein
VSSGSHILEERAIADDTKVPVKTNALNSAAFDQGDGYSGESVFVFARERQLLCMHPNSNLV